MCSNNTHSVCVCVHTLMEVIKAAVVLIITNSFISCYTISGFQAKCIQYNDKYIGQNAYECNSVYNTK